MGLKDFQIVSKLGEGAFSSVYKVKRISDGQEYAMKKVKMASLSEKEKQNALNEVRILASIKNPFIIGYKEAFFEDNSITLCIVMEYAAGGDIYNRIVQHQKARTYIKEEDIWNYAIQMIVGLKTLHDMRILHRDLKCANIFLSKDGKEVRLGDLNVSKVAKTNLVYTQTGTPYYASPEVWRDQPYDSKSDIWSLGCVLYEMCALKPPFRANDMSGLNKKIQRGVFDRIPSQYSTELHNLISLCLQVSPSLRPNCDKLLSHPSILKHGQEFVKNLDDIFGPNELLGTIKLPRNIRALGGQLPKPNYDEARSEGSEKGRLNRSDEEEKQAPVKRPQRAFSQQGKRVVDRVLVKPPSRQYRIPSGQREPLSNENQEPKIQARPKVVLERPRHLKNPSRGNEIEDNAKIMHNNDKIVVRRQIEPLDRKKGGNLQENRGPIHNIRVVKQGQENIDQNIRVEKPRQQAREKVNVLKEKGYSEQDYLVNKYLGLEQAQNNNRKVLDRISSERNDLVNRRADDIVRRYYADAILAEKREPLSELRMVGGTPVNDYASRDILERYNNAYNMKEPSSRTPGSRNAKYRKVDSSNIGQNNVGNNINMQRQQELQQRGVVKPSWWG